jgi:hypothetical protein
VATLPKEVGNIVLLPPEVRLSKHPVYVNARLTEEGSGKERKGKGRSDALLGKEKRERKAESSVYRRRTALIPTAPCLDLVS